MLLGLQADNVFTSVLDTIFNDLQIGFMEQILKNFLEALIDNQFLLKV